MNTHPTASKTEQQSTREYRVVPQAEGGTVITVSFGRADRVTYCRGLFKGASWYLHVFFQPQSHSVPTCRRAG